MENNYPHSDIQEPIEETSPVSGKNFNQLFKETPVTFTAGGICILFYLLVQGEVLLPFNISDYLVPSMARVWNGAWWGLITSNFLHYDFFHLFFNMILLLYLGRNAEKHLKRGQYLVLILTACIGGMGLQYFTSEVAALGYSGVNYGYVGVGMVHWFCYRSESLMRKRDMKFFLFFLVLGFLFNKTGLMAISNAGHLGGLLAGVAGGLLWFLRKKYGLVLLGLLSLTAFLGTAYKPWSLAWQHRKEAEVLLKIINAAERGDKEAQFQAGVLYITYSTTRDTGEVWLIRAAEQGHEEAMNTLAWYYAVSPDRAVRNGKRALKWALKVCEASSFKNYMHVDTLAASYAALGRWEEAVSYQDMALKLYLGSDSTVLEDLNNRLELFKRKELWFDENFR